VAWQPARLVEVFLGMGFLWLLLVGFQVGYDVATGHPAWPNPLSLIAGYYLLFFGVPLAFLVERLGSKLGGPIATAALYLLAVCSPSWLVFWRGSALTDVSERMLFAAFTIGFAGAAFGLVRTAQLLHQGGRRRQGQLRSAGPAAPFRWTAAGVLSLFIISTTALGLFIAVPEPTDFCMGRSPLDDRGDPVNVEGFSIGGNFEPPVARSCRWVRQVEGGQPIVYEEAVEDYGPLSLIVFAGVAILAGIPMVWYLLVVRPHRRPHEGDTLTPRAECVLS
jgi:hypothetical protein